ncbi:2Fe-2S iron-sulfur cluster-binding protein [Desulfurivibrio alkaliphilus]|uniref:Ferredoxin n=1 Tax=Desulfurivibrio alkaliphilus (strain DSM 19089 / UNIQEM U267 / AHT2) TaxID=589865 RepID=D6Z135_DESAT|nr:2Fe-2S iron-sulfur cluster binding domain-containing protein [Desulfurivibrio alkaliphilus]ADH87295.1 ferredoxin [Desulfurivibrio alkaliphilus AHT 2]
MKTIKFLPNNVSSEVEEGGNLLAVAWAGGYVNAYCVGDGGCGKCKVAVESGEAESDKARLKSDDYSAGPGYTASPVTFGEPSSRCQKGTFRFTFVEY